MGSTTAHLLILAIMLGTLIVQGRGFAVRRRNNNDPEMPPGLFIKAFDGEKIYVPLPCTSSVCTALLFRLAELGKVPWSYVNLPEEVDLDRDLKLLKSQEPFASP